MPSSNAAPKRGGSPHRGDRSRHLGSFTESPICSASRLGDRARLGSGVRTRIGFIPTPFMVLVVLTIAWRMWFIEPGVSRSAEPASIPRPSAESAGQLGSFARARFVFARSAPSWPASAWPPRWALDRTRGASYALPCFAAVFLGSGVDGRPRFFRGSARRSGVLSLFDNVIPLLKHLGAWSQTYTGSSAPGRCHVRDRPASRARRGLA